MRVIGKALDLRRRQLQDNTLLSKRMLPKAAPQDVVCTLNPDGHFTQVSPLVLRLLGYPPQELVGASWADLAHPDHRGGIAAFLREPGSGHSPHTLRTLCRRRDGSYASVTWSAVFSPAQKTIFALATDATEAGRDDERARQAERLEAIGRMTGGIAHDFNNLLSVIIGSAEALAETRHAPRAVKELALSILAAAERGADLTGHLLAFARRQPLRPVQLNLGRLVEEITPLLRRATGETLDLVTEVGHTSLLALADRTLFESALLNLVLNARDATPAGGRITIRTGQRAALPEEEPLRPGQDVVFLSVADTGSGIEPHHLDRVFDPFFSTKERGSGLGLAMVYGFVSQSGGHVGLASKLGEGTVVYIVLPAVVARPLRADAADSAEPVPERLRILVASADVTLSQLVSAQLLGLGCEVTLVTSLLDAARLLTTGQSFEFLLADIAYRPEPGRSLLEGEAMSRSPGLRIVYISPGTDEDPGDEGGTGRTVVSHPFKRSDLSRILAPAAARRVTSHSGKDST